MLRQIFFVFISYLALQNAAFAQQVFNCDGSSFISVISSGQTSFYELTLSDIGLSQSPISIDFDASINAIGFNPKDSLIYGIDTETNQLYKVWADGLVEGLQYIPLQGDYFAGDIHPNGDQLVLLNSDSIAFVHLNKMETPVEYVPISTSDQSRIFTTDIAFHPITRELFAYDGLQGKLIKIDVNTGQVDNISFPRINFNDGIPALFFDARAELYGIGNNNAEQNSTLFKFDINTGEAERFSYDAPIGDRDGCSCPFTLKVFQKVNNSFLAPCSNMELVITLSNLTGADLPGYGLIENFPNDFIIEEIVSNPFQGDIISGIGANQLSIENMEIPFGVDSIKLILSIPESAAGSTHELQAQLTGFNPGTNQSTTLNSSDLLIAENNSKTQIFIETATDIFNDRIPEFIELCENDTFMLELPLNPDFEYVWSDGFEGVSRIFTTTENVNLEVIGDCQTLSFDIDAQETQFSITLGDDIFIEQGQRTLLKIETNSISPVDSFVWKTIDGDIPCLNCQSIQVLASEDIKYIATAVNASGCITSDEINLFVTRNIYAPNIFSPDGDGFNDFFYLLSGSPSIGIGEMTIYNRWGAIVFQAQDIRTGDESSGWDGKFKGRIAPAGTYFWIANIAIDKNRNELYQGTLVLKK